MSDGRLRIKVYGSGELVPALGIFDAINMGIVEMGHAASYYWAGKSPALQFFTSVPFGMTAQQMNSWYFFGGGLKLWEEVYEPFSIIPIPAGNTGAQMGGWFNKAINSLKDYRGLKMRLPGLGRKVITKAGASAVLSPGSEIYLNLERGVIDATDWVGPYHDYIMKFYKIAQYYYYPGWHEPAGNIELIVNKKVFEKLPSDLQEIVRNAAGRANIWMLSEFESKNNIYLQKLINEHNVKLNRFPDDVLKAFRKYTHDVISDIVAKDAMSKKVYGSFSKFQKNVSQWTKISEI